MSFFVRLFRRGTGSCTPIIEVRKSSLGTSDVREKPVQLAAVANESGFSSPVFDGPAYNTLRGPSRRIALDMSETRLPTISSGDDLSVTSSSSTPELERYSVISSLHKSRNCSILQAEDKASGQVVILKVFSCQEVSYAAGGKPKTEVELQRRCKPCSGVVELLNVVELESSTIMVLEFCSGGTLTEALSRCNWKFSEAQGSSLAKCMLHTLAFLHEHSVAHRDIRPEHVLLTRSGHWKLADFGCAADIQTEHLNCKVGHLLYQAPEMLHKPAPEEVFHEVIDRGLSEEELPCYDEKVDVWSLGVVVCEVLIGRQPFMAENSRELWQLMQQVNNSSSGGLAGFLSPYGLSSEAVSFLSQALHLVPAGRPSAKSLLQHEWIRKCC